MVQRRDRTTRSGRLVVLDSTRPVRMIGRVWLVGAGPGDPELLTIKALKVLQSADVVVHDGLVSDEILAMSPAAARRISVAKRKSRHSYSQDEINRMLVAFALQGLDVVRRRRSRCRQAANALAAAACSAIAVMAAVAEGAALEELEACREAGIETHVVPGVTAALAASASAGAPLTHRGLAQAVTFVTGHSAKGNEPDLDWTSLAKVNHTVVIYMGLSMAALIAARLMTAGRSGSTPALIVENASRADERRVVTTLSELAESAASLDGPAMLIVGEAMALAQVPAFPVRWEGGPPAEERGVEVAKSSTAPGVAISTVRYTDGPSHPLRVGGRS